MSLAVAATDRLPADRGVVWRRDEPLRRHSPWRVGGAADVFVVIHARDALGDTLAALRAEDLPVTWLGAGTRTVFRDGGVNGAVVRLGAEFAELERDGLLVTAGAAVPVPALVAATSAAGCAGLEGLADTPGSLGAALMHDPGPDDGWAAVLDAVRYVSRGREREGSLEEARKAGVITGARFRLAAGEPAVSQARAAARRRGEVARGARPWTPPSSWLVPTRKVALRDVLERAQLADVRLRDVAIPAAAPELLVNLGDGCARDLELLFQSAIDRVRTLTGVELDSRIRFVGRRM